MSMCPSCARPVSHSTGVLCRLDHRYWHRPCLEQRARFDAGAGDACFDGEATPEEYAQYEARLVERSAALGLAS